MKVASLYLNTQTTNGKYVPVDKTNLANVKWSINWREIFGEYDTTDKLCRVKAKLVSSGSTTLSSANNQGSVRISITSQYSNITNGLNLGPLILRQTPDSLITYYMDLDTIQTFGLSANIPMSNDFFVQILKNDDKTLQSSVPEYQLWLYFDIDEDNDYENF